MTTSIAYIVAPATSDLRQDQKREIILRACKEANYAAHYPAYSPAHSTFDLIQERIEILAARLAFVDVSFERPSCYFELGLIEALGRPVVLVAEAGTFIHQTSYRQQAQFYSSLAEYDGLIRSALGGAR